MMLVAALGIVLVQILGGSKETISSLPQDIALAAAPLWLAAFGGFLGTLILIPEVLLAVMFVFYSRKLGIVASPDLVEDLANTNPTEVARLASVSIVMLVLFAEALSVSLFFTLTRRLKGSLGARIAAPVLGIATLVLFPSDTIMKESHAAAPGYPANLVTATKAYLEVRKEAIALSSYRANLPQQYAFARASNDDLLVVFVRGEAARALNFSLLGYKGNITNPLLAARGDEVVGFPNVYSFANHTAAAVPYMFTRATPENPAPLNGESTLISVFRALGFKTYWIGADESNFAKFASPVVAVAREAEYSAFLGPVKNRCTALDAGAALDGDKLIGGCHFDSKSLVYTKWILKEATGPTFVVMETNGSHIPYYYLIPPEFSKFKPVCGKEVEELKRCSTEQLRNEYDNTILYTDYLLDDLIRYLQDRNAMMFYIADHGQSIGEDGQYGQGYLVDPKFQDSKEQRNVAALAWFSPKARERYPEAWKHLSEHSPLFMGHDVIFHSLLGCAGVLSPAINAERNLCGASFMENNEIRRKYSGPGMPRLASAQDSP